MKKHKLWKEREAELLIHAKSIYKESKNFDSSVDLDTVGDDIYDMLTEDDWQTLRAIEKTLKAKYNS